MTHNHCCGQGHRDSTSPSSLFLSCWTAMKQRRRASLLQLLSVTIILSLRSNLGCGLIIWCTALLTDLLLCGWMPAISTTDIFCGNGKNTIKPFIFLYQLAFNWFLWELRRLSNGLIFRCWASPAMIQNRVVGNTYLSGISQVKQSLCRLVSAPNHPQLPSSSHPDCDSEGRGCEAAVCP